MIETEVGLGYTTVIDTCHVLRYDGRRRLNKRGIQISKPSEFFCFPPSKKGYDKEKDEDVDH